MTLLANPSWSPDGIQLVLERDDESLDDGRVVLVTFDGSEEALQRAHTVAHSDGAPMLPVFDANGNIVVIRQRSGPDETYGLDLTQPERAETYKTESDGAGGFTFYGDAISAVQLDGPVLSQRATGGGRFVLRTFADGTFRADLGQGDTPEILRHGYLDAAW